MREMSLDLELSQQRFFWVVWPSCEGNGSGLFFEVSKSGDEALNYLLERFMKMEAMGVVVPM